MKKNKETELKEENDFIAEDGTSFIFNNREKSIFNYGKEAGRREVLENEKFIFTNMCDCCLNNLELLNKLKQSSKGEDVQDIKNE